MRETTFYTAFFGGQAGLAKLETGPQLDLFSFTLTQLDPENGSYLTDA